MGYRVETVDSKDKYEGLRDLWCRVFGDEPGFVDFFYESFGGDIRGYVIRNDAGKTISALTCFRCGLFRDAPGDAEGGPAHDAPDGPGGGADSLPVYVSYAICTEPEYRGQGHAAALTEYVRSIVTAPRGTAIHGEDDGLSAAEGLGGISLVSPAEESLIGYYDRLGYRETFLVDEHAVHAGEEELPEEEDWSVGAEAGEQSAYIETSEQSAAADTRFWGLGPDGNADFLDEEDGEAFEPELSVESVSGSMYNRYREEFLAGIPHVEMSPEMMEFLRADGDGGLLVINGGDAVCRVVYAGNTVMLDELLVNPQLRAFSEEIEEEIALRLAEHFGAETLVYRTPGSGRCQSMSAAANGAEAAAEGAYFGFPIE
ncbi:MAG: hypothetical protein IJY32_05465 [Mogibacterium sp.]|nr:hypothetical protein [Mogibacterium sp.]